MSRAQPPRRWVCPECGATLPEKAAECWLCHRAASPAFAAPQVVSPGTVPERRAQFQFTIASLMLITALVAVILGAGTLAPGLGIGLAVLAAPALVHTAVTAAIGIGRLACFHAGCCYGTPTSLPWGVDFGDGLARHPTQLYESLFHLTAAVFLYRLQRRGMLRGQLIRWYFVAYFGYRFATEFIRPEPPLWLGLTGYQWAALVLGPVFAVWSCPGCRPLGARPRMRPRPLPGDPSCLLLKETHTLCPACRRPLAGQVFEREGRVFLRRTCPEHGRTDALVSSDRRLYWLRGEVPHAPLAPGGCCCAGPGHRTCVALLEVTGACDLRCPVCFAGGGAGTHRPVEELCADLEAFLSARGPLDIVQLSGGEPLLHPDLLRLIDRAKQLPVGHVMINTNGLELLRRAGLAAELARRRPRLELYLQFDGLDAASHLALRGADLLKQKLAVLEKVVRHDLPTTLVSTLVQGVNEDQVGRLLNTALQVRQVRGIVFQPATWSGRFDRAVDPLERTTLAGAVLAIVRQSGGLFAPDDFKPLPCADPNCCAFTVALRPREGPAVPLARLVRYEDHLDRLSDRMDFNLADAQELCGPGLGPEDFFRVVVKPFMDAYTYDRDRINECCVHVIRPGGRAVSFCQFNILQRNLAPAAGADDPGCAHAGPSLRA